MSTNMRAGLLLIALLLALLGTASAAPVYTLSATAKVTGRYTVAVTIKTNLPDGAVLSASLDLAGQKPEDVYIGTNFKRVTVKNGKASVVLDGTSKALPTGTYEVEVDFHPNWDENTPLGLSKKLTSMTRVKLGGSGASATSAQKKEEAQKWVMLNVDSGASYAATNLEGRYGSYVVIPLAAGHGNPRVLQMRYFPAIDMTFMVNVNLGTIEVWRKGKASS